ncbi:Cof-type HAD-IIB family hydrolase [Clostridium estertheticum]|uniref:Cof-type HAD-IIB family hydrolase n=1 Tax=Clostridium estertheticum TaxID=238834 RepID=UPI001C0D1000|nr:Cof-type HAD-IIB family hydrolase [Clostridium estertheticum]MBU3217044.1 Cof-type HAD-IIB family hydrolase [Clostridium estertheticum]WAG56094.1 Cof-type HAD-IIB family hydrolase [Clostridium estertheticum]
MKYKLMCIDMDGTLLNSKRVVSDINKNAIKKAHDLGVQIVIATGRVYSNAAFYSNLIGVKSPVIASNGAIIKEKLTDKIIYKNELGIENLAKIIEVCHKHKLKLNLNTHNSIISASRLIYVITKYIFLKSMMNSENGKLNIRYVSKHNLLKTIKENSKDIIKCEILDTSPRRLEIAKEDFKKIVDLEIVSSSKNNIEITSKSVSKGQAVKELAKYYNLEVEEIITIGDSQNDLSMIEYAGLGIAMGNGTELVKSKADYITDTNDNDGVAKAINKFILNNSN